jgi:cobaltochelatase CobT
VTTPAVEQQRVEELCAASIRALTGMPEIHYRGRRLVKGNDPLPVYAPHQQSGESQDLADRRGVSDGVALRLLYCDAALHRKLCPVDPVERLVFEMLEQFRVESLVSGDTPGVRHNLDLRFGRWSDEFAESGLVDSDLGLLLFAVSQICRARILGQQVLERYEDLLEPTRAGIAPLLGHELAGIRRTRHDQLAFSRHALSIARIVAASISAAEAERPARAARNDERRAIFSLSLDFDEHEGEGFAIAETGESKTAGESGDAYRIFTRRYDREIHAADLVRKAQLSVLRRELDERVAKSGINISRLARLFKAMLAVPQRDGLNFGEESGYVDGRRLSQLVASPAERRLFSRARYQPHARCRFTILVDCSGSMKQYLEPLSCLVDIMVRALEQAEVRTELLGFTTGAWSGGRAQRDWVRNGRPPHPGRLNETCQMIFKDADETWRRERRSIAALLKQDLFREGVDGEAVEWACRRLSRGTAERRILLVISDGSPMDTATALANDPFYLDNHLQRVVSRWTASRQVEIYGLGVGLDLSPYYDRSLAVDLATGISNRLLFEMLEMIRGHHRR